LPARFFIGDEHLNNSHSSRDGNSDRRASLYARRRIFYREMTTRNPVLYHGVGMAFPIKVCAVCSEEFELKPDKPGFANRCPDCSAPEADTTDAEKSKVDKEANEARREAMRNLLYRKDS
jgi:hypothetical protein